MLEINGFQAFFDTWRVLWENSLPVFRTFLQHPLNYLKIKYSLLNLGVAKLQRCLSESLKIGLGVLVFR